MMMKKWRLWCMCEYEKEEKKKCRKYLYKENYFTRFRCINTCHAKRVSFFGNKYHTLPSYHKKKVFYFIWNLSRIKILFTFKKHTHTHIMNIFDILIYVYPHMVILFVSRRLCFLHFLVNFHVIFLLFLEKLLSVFLLFCMHFVVILLCVDDMTPFFSCICFIPSKDKFTSKTFIELLFMRKVIEK